MGTKFTRSFRIAKIVEFRNTFNNLYMCLKRERNKNHWILQLHWTKISNCLIVVLCTSCSMCVFCQKKKKKLIYSALLLYLCTSLFVGNNFTVREQNISSKTEPNQICLESFVWQVGRLAIRSRYFLYYEIFWVW